MSAKDSLRPSIWAASAALLAALSAVMALLKLKIPFPLLPFLTFHLSEIPVVLAYLLLGLGGGLLAALAGWLALLAGAAFHPGVGPTMKFLAEASMLLGFALAGGRRRGLGRRELALMGAVGAAARISVMSTATFALYYLLFPEVYLPFAGKVLSRLFGLEVGSQLALTLIIVGLTSVFNLLHTPLSLLPAAAIYKAYRRAFPANASTS